MTAAQPIPPPILATIPNELKERPQWVVWRAIWKADPKKPNGGKYKKS